MMGVFLRYCVYGLTNIFNFRGHDTRIVFWCYALMVHVFTISLNVLVDIIWAPVPTTNMKTSILISGLLVVCIMFPLLAAACVRRLRDAGLSKDALYIFLLFLFIATTITCAVMNDDPQNLSLFPPAYFWPVVLANLAYLSAFALLIWKLCKPTAIDQQD